MVTQLTVAKIMKCKILSIYLRSFFLCSLMLLPLFLYADYGDGLYGGGVYNGSLPSQPSVETAAATSIEKTSATLNGNIASVGDTNPTIRGFIYAENLTLTDNVATTSESGTYSTGSYSTNLTSLTCATTYYFQAFATNANGNGYGPVLSFTTSNCSSSNGRGGGSSSTRVNDDNEIESTTLSIDDETLSTNTNNIQVTRLNIFKPLCVPNTFDKNLKISRDLYTGSFGNEVSALQQFLKDKGYFNYPEITGYFGEVTKNAVAEFQKDNGIEPLGGVGPKTRMLLNGIH